MLGIDDEKFIRGKIPMTKREVRILTLANANISENDIVVDIGAGTGSISIEAAILAKNGRVYAFEKKSEGVKLIEQNAEKFAVKNIKIINAEAPNELQKLPQVDVAIIGGSSGLIEDILSNLNTKLKVGGRIVINCITVQTLSASLSWFKSHKEYKYSAMQVQITHFKNLGFYDMAEALNPVHIITATKISRIQAPNIINIANAKNMKICNFILS